MEGNVAACNVVYFLCSLSFQEVDDYGSLQIPKHCRCDRPNQSYRDDTAVPTEAGKASQMFRKVGINQEIV